MKLSLNFASRTFANSIASRSWSIPVTFAPVAKIASVVVGAIAIGLGLLFEGMNVTYLVGWAFSVAASANLPALVMLLFWKGTTKYGLMLGIMVGLVSSLSWILVCPDTFAKVYGLPPSDAWVQLSQPGLFTIPLGFLAVFVGSKLTKSSLSR